MAGTGALVLKALDRRSILYGAAFSVIYSSYGVSALLKAGEEATQDKVLETGWQDVLYIQNFPQERIRQSLGRNAAFNWIWLHLKDDRKFNFRADCLLLWFYGKDHP